MHTILKNFKLIISLNGSELFMCEFHSNSIEENFGLPSLGRNDATANSWLHALQFASETFGNQTNKVTIN